TAIIHIGLLACLTVLISRLVSQNPVSQDPARNALLSIRDFAGGANNLPLLPSPYVLLYLGSLLVAIVPVLAETVQAAFGQGAGPRFRAFGTLTGAFAIHSLAMM